MKTLLTVFAVLLTSLPLQASAFHIPEHVLITQRAIEGLQKCNLLPKGWDMGWSLVIASANKAEDTNLIRKWSKYSHFYNPNKRIRMPREDALISVTESMESIEEHDEEDDEKSVYKLVGRMVHHIQDAAVPAHVVPVNHFAFDGFEKANITRLYLIPVSISECTRLAARDPAEVLRQTALTTLANIDQSLTYKLGGKERTTRWSQAFWKADAGDGFGKYGALKNSFGKEKIKLHDGRVLTVNPVQYGKFKRAQVELAIAATQSAILWANQQIQ